MSGRRIRATVDESGPLGIKDRSAEHLLDLLTRSGWPLTIEELREHGVSPPAQAIYELQLAGYEIDRVVQQEAGHQRAGYRLRRAETTITQSAG